MIEIKSNEIARNGLKQGKNPGDAPPDLPLRIPEIPLSYSVSQASLNPMANF